MILLPLRLKKGPILSAILLALLPLGGGHGSESKSARNRWNWLAGTRWYVQAENLLAYQADPTLRVIIPSADQTLWWITEARDGWFRGYAYAQYWIKGPEGLVKLPGTESTLEGEISADGTVTITFTPKEEEEEENKPVTIGYGHMRFVEKAWRAEMQMATGTSTIAIHWAYMTQLKGNQQLPPVTERSFDGSLRAEEWNWLYETHWGATDKELFADGAKLSVDGFRNGYFWGKGVTADLETVRFLGSVTPEGEIYVVFSVAGAFPVARAGTIEGSEDAYMMDWAEPGNETLIGGATILP